MKAIMMTVFAIGMAGCLAMEPPSTAADDPSAATSAPEAQSQLTGEPDGAASAPITPAAQDCVFIDFCNQPGSNGTVCIVRNTAACQAQCSPSILSAIVSECQADARAVCGAIVQPARIFCSRSQE